MHSLDRLFHAIRSRSGLGGLLALGATLAACRTEPAGLAPVAEQVLIGDVRWYVDYAAALTVAREQDKALWVHFGENPG